MRLFFTVFIVFRLVVFGFTQSYLSNADLMETEKALLNSLSLVRDTSGFSVYRTDESLKQASEHHLAYCLKLKTIKHQEKSEKYKTVVERTKRYGSYHGAVTELITRVKVKQSFTEVERAEALIKSLFSSPKRKRVILTQNLIEIGVSLGERDGYLYAVIVLGSEVVFSKELSTPDNLYGIKGITLKNKPVCDACKKKFNEMPREVSYDVFQEDGKVFFVMSSQEWFARIFNDKKDGLAIDIIRKAQYACGIPNVKSESSLYNGYVLPPVYAKDFKEKAFINDYEEVVVPLGEIPVEWREEELELNLMVLQQNIVCRYNTYFRVPFEDWKILDLDFNQEYLLDGELVNFQEKEMEFEVPFEKGKVIFDSTDIQPLADSLQLTDFSIESINIRAYSSIEGTESQNIRLQEDRANSIVEALKRYEKAQVKNIVVSSEENWVEFFNDIQKTEQAFLLKKSKDEIREYVNLHLTPQLENILKNHRKAKIKIQLKRKDNFETVNYSSLDQVLAGNNREDIYYLLHRIVEQESSKTEKLDLLKYLESKILVSSLYSEQLESALLLQRYMIDKEELANVLTRMEYLTEKNPVSFNLRYNTVLLKLRLWFEKGEIDNPERLKSSISALTGVTAERRNRLWINFYILETARYLKGKKYREKDASIREVVRRVAMSRLTEQEAFVVARFYADYQKYKEAINVLKPYVYRLNADEELLFLYINLTIIDNNTVKQTAYRTALTNASQSNKARFCKLFDSSSSGGITFQLLENQYLKRTYCEQCER